MSFLREMQQIPFSALVQIEIANDSTPIVLATILARLQSRECTRPGPESRWQLTLCSRLPRDLSRTLLVTQMAASGFSVRVQCPRSLYLHCRNAGTAALDSIAA